MGRRPSIGISGVGAVTGYGWGREALWNGLLTGKHAARLEPAYGENDETPGWVVKIPAGGDELDGPSRFARAMRAAAREAVSNAKARGWTPGRRVGLVHAIVLGDVDSTVAFHAEKDVSKRRYLATMPSTPISTLLQEHGFHGPAMAVSAMCASGNAALLTAKMWLDADIVDDVLVVATDVSLTPENVRHFVKLGVCATDAEPTEVCRPFQEGSRGFAMGEAAVGFILSRNESSHYMKLLGGAMSHDAHHVTSVNVGDLTEVRRCFYEALFDANVGDSEVRYLNAHGPGTAQCDYAESTMLEEFFPGCNGVYSVKQLVGHCQGAASAVEIAVAALGYERGYLPLPDKVSKAHPKLLTGVTPFHGGITVKSSLGMGGHNSVTVFGPKDEQ